MILKGKKIAFLGDSITEGVGVSDQANRYDRRIERECGLAALWTDAISGSRFAYQFKPSEWPRQDLCFAGRACNLPLDLDVIVVFGGTNDYGHGDAPFGSLEDKTVATFCGATRFMMELFHTRYEGKPIVFLTPARRLGGDTVASRRQNDPEGRPLLDYVDAIKTIAKDYGVYVIDLYRELGIDPSKEEDREAFAPDGLHFNDAGHGVIAEKLIAFFASI